MPKTLTGNSRLSYHFPQNLFLGQCINNILGNLPLRTFPNLITFETGRLSIAVQHFSLCKWVQALWQTNPVHTGIGNLKSQNGLKAIKQCPSTYISNQISPEIQNDQLFLNCLSLSREPKILLLYRYHSVFHLFLTK